jgi:hypothetical protein
LDISPCGNFIHNLRRYYYSEIYNLKTGKKIYLKELGNRQCFFYKDCFVTCKFSFLEKSLIEMPKITFVPLDPLFYLVIGVVDKKSTVSTFTRDWSFEPAVLNIIKNFIL